ncbi:MAG TPA: hypothetical protein VEV41_08680 [Terriglobales bacterium]|jgi:hypothetical protein|nr:hypothetical protein [Terriglobales bacterium]
MITTFILVAIAIVALAFFLAMVRGGGAAVTDVSDLHGRTRPVDLVAFRNLMDPDEEEYLRAHLPPGEFRVIQRERLRAALDYVRCVAINARLLLRLGEAARRSEDPQVAEAGQELVNSALRVRVYTLFVEGKLYAGILMPGMRISSAHITDSYEHLTGLLSRLGRLQDPSRAHRMAAIL